MKIEVCSSEILDLVDNGWGCCYDLQTPYFDKALINVKKTGFLQYKNSNEKFFCYRGNKKYFFSLFTIDNTFHFCFEKIELDY